jgi:hypothetical protein
MAGEVGFLIRQAFFTGVVLRHRALRGSYNQVPEKNWGSTSDVCGLLLL